MTSSVNVVIATYRRPDRLQTALSSLATSAAEVAGTWDVGVTVVDDDPAGSARETVDRFGSRFSAGCTYIACGSQNISTARNAGLESALPRAAWVGSIDDDVVVPLDWFAVCARAVADGTHHAVTGPLLKDFRHGPRWLTEEPFDQLGLMTGEDGDDATVCATGNNWVESRFLLERPSLRFSTDLGRTGGEDMDFFYRAVEQGLRPVYSRSAAVTETEPAERCTFRYQLRRAFWLGISEAQVSLRLGLASRPRLFARGLRRALERGRRQLPPDLRPQHGPRYSVAILAQCVGLWLGCAGLQMRHK